MASHLSQTTKQAQEHGVKRVYADRPLRGRTENRPVERLIRLLLLGCATVSILTTLGIVFILSIETLNFFESVSVWEFYTGTTWTALFNDPEYGVLPLVTGTLVISIIAILVAVPIGLAAAIYLSMYARRRVRQVVKPILEVLAGIPTVVFGYFGLTFVTPEIVQRFFSEAQVFNALAAGLTVGILIVPLVSSLSEDAIQAVPQDLSDGGFALGGTRFEVAMRVVVPGALSGIVASVILAFSRAIGETMIVTLVSGGTPNFWSPIESMQAMTAYIVQIATGDVARGTVKYETLFAVGFTLFLMTLGVNFLSHALVRRFREEYQ